MTEKYDRPSVSKNHETPDSRKNLIEMKSSLGNQTVEGIKKILPNSFNVSQSGEIIGKNTGHVYAKIDITSFRKIPGMEYDFNIHSNTGKRPRSGESVFYRDNKGLYLYEAENNVFTKIEGASQEIYNIKYTKHDSGFTDSWNTLTDVRFVSGGKLYGGFGQELLPFPEGRKWDKDTVVYGNFELIEQNNGLLYVKSSDQSTLVLLPFKRSDVWIKIREWEFLETGGHGEEIYIVLKKGGKVISPTHGPINASEVLQQTQDPKLLEKFLKSNGDGKITTKGKIVKLDSNTK